MAPAHPLVPDDALSVRLARCVGQRSVARAPGATAKSYASVQDLVADLNREAAAGPLSADAVAAAMRWLDARDVADYWPAFEGLWTSGAFYKLMTQGATQPLVNGERIRLAFLVHLRKRKYSAVGFEIEHRAALASLSATDRAALIKPLAPLDVVAEMRATKGFQALSQDEQDRLSVYVGGSTSISEGAPAAMRTLLDDATKDTDSAATFQAFFKAQSSLPYKAKRIEPELLDLSGALTGPTDVKRFKMDSGKTDAKRWEVTVGASKQDKIAIYEPKNGAAGGLSLPTVPQVVFALETSLHAVRAQIKQIHLNPKPNPADAYWKKHYKNFTSSFMTAGADGIVSIYPTATAPSSEQVAASLSHESGHVISQRTWGTNEKNAKWKPWRAAMKSDGIAPSGYAKNSPDEDYAETWRLWVHVRNTPKAIEVRTLLPARIKIMEKMVAGYD